MTNLPGQNINDFENPYKDGSTGEYSNYAIYSTVHLLDGAPLNDHVPGEGYHPGDVFMSRKARGLDPLEPLDDAGIGPRPAGYRFRPLEYKGLEGAKIFPDDFGSDFTTKTAYKQAEYEGIPDAPLATDILGHAIRFIDDPDAPATFGRTDPYDIEARKVGDGILADPEHTGTTYAHDKVQEWFGVPSAKAL